MKRKVKKVCKICGIPKELKDFVIHRGYKDDHSNICKDCNREKYHRSFRSQVLESLKRIEDKLN